MTIAHTPELGFVVAMAQAQPAPRHLAHAAELVHGGLAWDRVYALAVRNNIVPLLCAQLDRPDAPVVPPAWLAELRETSATIRRMSALLFGRQMLLIERVLLPRGIPFAMIKGASLSQQCFGDPLLRHARDIDLLIDPNRLSETASVLLEQGWAVVNPSWRGQRMDAFARYSSVVEMRSPEGVRVELHRTLDNSGFVFDSARLLADVQHIAIAGRSLPVLSRRDLFAYLCFHHSRHAWSCFAWCADLIAVSATLTAEVVDECVAHHPLLARTIGASIALAQDFDRIAAGTAAIEISDPSPFLATCIASIDRDRPPVLDNVTTDPADMEPDFPLRWQRTWRYWVRFQAHRACPNLNDYDAFPVQLRHAWMLWVLRPFRVLARRLAGLVGSRFPSGSH